MKNYNLIFMFIVGGFWSFYVLIFEVISFFKNALSYFKSPKTVTYPSCVADKNYGKSKFVEIDTTKGLEMEKMKLRLHYVEKGDKNYPTMVLIHGFPEFWFSWRHQLIEFGKQYRVIAIDMRGYGLTDKPGRIEDYQIKHLINDVKGLLDALDLRSVILVAHDWGGAVAWSFENAYPEMVEKLIVLNIPEPTAFRKVLMRSWKQFLKSWYMFFFQYPYLPEWKLSRFDLKMVSSTFTSKIMGLRKSTLSAEEVDSFKANMAQPGSLTAAVNYYRASARYPSTKNVNSRRTEKNRYMLIFGESDGAIEVECAKETQVSVPNLNLVLLPGLSHWVQQDDPVLVNKHIRDFLEA